MESRVQIADIAIDPEMLLSFCDFEINLKLRHIPVAVSDAGPAQSGPYGPGPSRSYKRRPGRPDYVDKRLYENGQSHSSVRVNSVEAKVTTELL